VDLGAPCNVEAVEGHDVVEWYDSTEQLFAACGFTHVR
jgi:hypothetical protein